MSKPTDRNPSGPRLVTVRADTPATLERALREFTAHVIIAADDARERCFAEASAIHQRLLSLRGIAA